MGIAERKIRQKEEVRASILKAAWQLVAQEGWQALSIRRIADAIEYSSPVIYDHFANKEAILMEFTRQGFQLLNEELLKAKESVSEPGQQLEAMAYAYWKFAFTHKEYYQLMYGLGMPTCEMVRQVSEVGSFTELIMESVKSLMAQGRNSNADAFLKFQTFWSMLHGLISINMMSKDNSREGLNELVLKDFIGSFISGIRG